MPSQLSVVRKAPLVVALLGLMAMRTFAGEEPAANDPSSLRPAPLQNMTSDGLFAKLLEHSRIREMLLKRYSAVRTYRVTNDKGKVYAQEVVRVQYQAPDHKKFVVDSEEGSWLIRKLVFQGLLESESETSSGRAHRDSSIGPANYDLRLLGEQDVGPYHCLVAEAHPRRNDKYLFRGKIWVDANDYAIVRIAGQPAQELSFWITRADFVRQYQKIGQFWLPARDQTLVHVRLYGKKFLTIQHGDYRIDPAPEGVSQHQRHDEPTNTQ
jgi:hypothetical protein